MNAYDEKPSDGRTLAIAVVTAALTTLATEIVRWAVEEVKERRRPKERTAG